MIHRVQAPPSYVLLSSHRLRLLFSDRLPPCFCTLSGCDSISRGISLTPFKKKSLFQFSVSPSGLRSGASWAGMGQTRLHLPLGLLAPRSPIFLATWLTAAAQKENLHCRKSRKVISSFPPLVWALSLRKNNFFPRCLVFKWWSYFLGFVFVCLVFAL